MKRFLFGLAIVLILVTGLAGMLKLPLDMVPLATLVTAILLVTVLIIDGKIKITPGGLRIRK